MEKEEGTTSPEKMSQREDDSSSQESMHFWGEGTYIAEEGKRRFSSKKIGGI